MLRSGRYALIKLREKGFFYCVKALCGDIGRFSYKFICLVIGMFSYPVCLITNVRFLKITSISSIGHLSVEPDCYIKEGILGLHPMYNPIILAPHKKVANVHLLNYWRRYIKIISSPLLCILLDPLSQNRFTTYNIKKYASVLYKGADYPKIQREYSGRPPLLSLTEFDYKRGWASLRELGVPEGAWFVCVHCREEGYAPRKDQMYAQKHRNADIHNYIPAMETIVKRGGWVIRMGDPTMKPIPQMDHVIDYAHLDIRSDWMDIFLCASCKFFIGSDSGLFTLANVFGVPAGVVNMAPMEMVLTYGTSNVSIPKFVWSLREKRYLSFKEVFSSSISNFRFDYLYSEAGVCTVENSPDDIKEVAMEMLDRIEGKALYTTEDDRLQERFKSFMNRSHYSDGAISRVGRDFLRKYAFLLNEPVPNLISKLK